MEKKATLSVNAIFGIILSLIACVALASVAFLIPGFFGMLFGLIFTALSTVASTFWDIIGPYIMPIISSVKQAIRFGITFPLTLGAIGVARYAAVRIGAYMAGREASEAGIQSVSEILAEQGISGFSWQAVRAGLVTAGKGLVGLAKGMIVGAVVELAVSAGLNYLGVPQWIDARWAPATFQTPLGQAQWSWGQATSGAIAGAAGGAAVGLVAAGFTFGLSVPICAAVGAAVGFITGGLFH